MKNIDQIINQVKYHMDYHLGDDSPDPISKVAFDRIVKLVSKVLRNHGLVDIDSPGIEVPPVVARFKFADHEGETYYAQCENGLSEAQVRSGDLVLLSDFNRILDQEKNKILKLLTAPMPPQDETDDTFYFITYGDREHSSVEVMDLSYACSYERDEFYVIDNKDYTHLQEAIMAARLFAIENGLVYNRFSSRYAHCLNEPIPESES